MTYYDTLAEGYDELHEAEQVAKLKIVLQHITFTGKILDVGAGTCIVARYLGRNIEVVSVDPSENMLNKGIGERHVAQAEKLPLADNTFDGIISLTALHHCNLKQALLEIQRVAKSKSILTLSFLKKSSKRKQFERLLQSSFGGYKKIEANQDFIYLIKHSH
ncbi:MAG TPA: class I SAM-dependent methyltransferase [Candidatus Nanoarchaeia archaeon]|nr:class I SAM-dependent methyltransferase [Candidatus Nanoarchaeia archaeon]